MHEQPFASIINRHKLPLLPECAHPEEVIPGAYQAAMLLADTIEAGHRIAVFCDYDPDGTSAAEVLRIALSPHCSVSYDAESDAQAWFGFAHAVRGFGLDPDFVRIAAERGTRVLITADSASASTEEVKLAQDLGMKVIVTDHHQIADDNSADHHLNPALHGKSNHSGSMVAWKFALAFADHIGDDLSALTERGQYVAIFGARSDWMDMSDVENAALLSFAKSFDQVPVGLRLIAEQFGKSDPMDDAVFNQVDALLNLPKRTPLAQASDAAAVLAAETAEEAQVPLQRLLDIHQRSETALAAMYAQAEQGANVQEVVTATITTEDVEHFTGHAGNVAHHLLELHQRPAVAFLRMEPDAWGNARWRWAARKHPESPGAFTDQLEELRKVSTVYQADAEGNPQPTPSSGGHPNAVSGRCTDDRLHEVQEHFRAWQRNLKNIS